MKSKKLFRGFIVAVVLLLVVESYIYINYSNHQKKQTRISFIVTGDNLDNYENMKAGAETAAHDEDCLVDFINSPTEYGVDGEIELLERQLTDGADFVIVATSDYDAMKEYVFRQNISGKVIFVKNGTYQDLKSSLLTDDYQMGCDFANYIIENSKAAKLLLVSTGEDINIKTVRQGLQDTMGNSDIKQEYRLLSATSGTLNQSMYNLAQSGLFDGIITLDNYTLEAAAKAQDKLKKPVEVYSIDNSRQAVYYLDSNLINAIAFKDEYSMGYLAVREVLSGKRSQENGNLFYLADKETIHSDRLEKVLFPFVK